MSYWHKIKKQYNIKLIKSIPLQIIAIILFVSILIAPQPVIEEDQPQQSGVIIAYLINLAIMAALAYFLTPKPKQPKPPMPIGLEQFDIPVAEEGRPIQVLFGKKYISSPNVVWYGHLKTVAIWG